MLKPQCPALGPDPNACALRLRKRERRSARAWLDEDSSSLFMPPMPTVRDAWLFITAQQTRCRSADKQFEIGLVCGRRKSPVARKHVGHRFCRQDERASKQPCAFLSHRTATRPRRTIRGRQAQSIRTVVSVRRLLQFEHQAASAVTADTSLRSRAASIARSRCLTLRQIGFRSCMRPHDAAGGCEAARRSFNDAGVLREPLG